MKHTLINNMFNSNVDIDLHIMDENNDFVIEKVDCDFIWKDVPDDSNPETRKYFEMGGSVGCLPDRLKKTILVEKKMILTIKKI